VLTVTGKNKEFVIVGQIVNNDIRVGRHNLLLRRKFGALLEFKVADGS